MLFLIFYFILCLIFLTISIVLYKAFAGKNKFETTTNSKYSFSIIIPFKNEAKNLSALLDSISNLDFDINNYEIIFVDDNSNDNGEKIISEFAKDKINIKLLSAENKLYPGKKGALQVGIDSAQYDYIITTDADCEIPKNWINEYAKIFSSNFDIAFGPVLFNHGKTFINKLTRFESLRKILLTFGGASLGLPFSAGGANFGFKKRAFENIGGYQNTLKTISGDDDLIIQEATKNKLRIAPIKNFNSAVTTNSVDSFNEYITQKARHTSTSHNYLLRNQIFLALWHGVNILLIISPVFILIDSIFFCPFIFKLLIDLFFLSKTNKKINYKFRFFEYPFLQIIYELLLPVNYLNSIFTKIHWK